MRYFKLENSIGEILDITTEEMLFHDIGGIGFEEENDFTPVGRLWKLNSSVYSQTPITGTMCFHSLDVFNSKTPYTLYREFYSFIAKPPLHILYYPNGLNTMEFRKRVRVSRLGKGEYNEYGVLECEIEFVPYTPWYKIVTDYIDPHETSGDSGWVWDRGNKWRDSLNVDYSTYHYKFNGSYRRTLRFVSDIDGNGPIKLSVYGPLVNPTWTQYVDGKMVATGGLVENSPVTISGNEILIIDNTNGIYSLTVYNRSTGVERNIYEYRDFNKQCFFTLKEGVNEIVINSDNADNVRIEAEGHVYYATV